MRESQTKIEKKKNIRNVRFASADSGIFSSLNMKVPRQRMLSKNDPDALEEDCLDFEPDVEDDSFGETINIEESTPRFYRNFEESAIKFSNSDFGDIGTSSNVLGNGSISTLSIGHRGEMIPTPKSDPQDARQNEYISPYFSPSENSRTILDSSSDDFSLSSRSSKYSTKDDSSRSLPHSDEAEKTLDTDNEMDDVYDITQDEEDQLLCSDDEDIVEEEEEEDIVVEEEDEEDEEEILQPNPFNKRMIVEKCHNGNMRITCSINTKFTSDAVTSEVTKTIKRSNTAKSLKRRKKKKWDLYFKPDVPPTQIFLNDIGWHCPGLDKNTSNEFQNQIISTAVCDDSFNFKLPLPPAKRPPTRPKRSVTNKEESNSNLNIKFFTKDLSPVGDGFKERIYQTQESLSTEDSNDTDDSISIIASSLGVENDDFPNQRRNNMDENVDCNTMTSKLSEHEDSLHSDYTTERIQSWIQNVPDSVITEPISISNSSNPEYQQNLCESLIVMPPVSAKGPNRIKFKDIPGLFTGICYHYYFNGHCVKAEKCPQPHNILVDKYAHRFQKSNSEDLTKAYQYALQFENFFKEIYPSFITAFGTLKMQNKLIASIRDFFKMSKIDTMVAVELVIKSLQESGLSFSDTIENISFNIGFLEYPLLADILLDMITRTTNISEHWEMIKRIAKAKGHISPKILNSRILRRVISEYPIDKNLCMDIYNVIIKNKITDLADIDNDCLISLQKIANHSNNLEYSLKSNSVPELNTIKFLSKTKSPNANPSELLAAHIDNSLIKEREKFEREVEGRIVRTVISNTSVNSPNNSFANKFDNTGRISGTSSGNVNSAYDIDNRYYFPLPKNNDITSEGIKNVQFILPNNSPTSSHTTSSHSHFEISPSNNYLPDTRQMNIRDDMSSSSSFEILNNAPPLKPTYLEFSLTPSRPIFGNADYEKNFNFERSLHHLLPNIIENVDINERDVSKLNQVIKNKDGVIFLNLLDYYSTPATIRNFITMTIVELKSCGDYLDDVLLGLLESLGMVRRDYATELYIKVVFEVVVMNVLFEFERRSKWENARRLLEVFCDWDSLISSQLFQIFSTRKISHMGRYLFLAKLFAKAKKFHFTYEILQCPNELQEVLNLRPLEVRLNEHKNNIRRGETEKSKISEHVWEHGHHIQWKNAKILEKEPTKKKRKLKETAIILLNGDKCISNHSVEFNNTWLDILKDEVNLHLLECCESWPYFYNYQVDLPKRNAILTDFFKNAYWYKYNIVHVTDMYRRIYKFGGIHGYDGHAHFNPMLIAIINGDTSLLKHFWSDIDIFYKMMEKDVLRAFTIIIGTQLNLKDLFRLYELCCERQIYTKYKGNEKRLYVETNMFDMELQLILDYFFCEMRKQQVEPDGDVIIQISLPRTRVLYLKMLQTCCRSVQEVNNRIKELLSVNYDIFVDNTCSSQPTVITVKHELIRNWFQGSSTDSPR